MKQTQQIHDELQSKLLWLNQTNPGAPGGFNPVVTNKLLSNKVQQTNGCDQGLNDTSSRLHFSISHIKRANDKLFEGCQNCDEHLIDIAIKEGAEINGQNQYGATVLHYTSASSNTKIVRLLLKNQADPNIQDNRGVTPLKVAMQSNQQEIIQLLCPSAILNSNCDSHSDSPVIKLNGCNKVLKDFDEAHTMSEFSVIASWFE